MKSLFHSLLEAIGEDPNREGLRKTPERAAKAFAFLTGGKSKDLDEIVGGAVFASSNSEMVIVRDIEFYSLCEHHLLPFHGRCSVGYLPNGKVLGLSKIPRIIDALSRRLQIQEELTVQIAEAIERYTAAHGVAVVMRAQHLCMAMRGVQKQNPVAVTSCMRGSFESNLATRSEFLNLIS